MPEEKVEIIYNWFDENNLVENRTNEELPDVLTKEDTFKVLFAGNMGRAQGLDTVLLAADLL